MLPVKREHRQVSLLALEKIEDFRNKGGNVDFGAFGENLVIEGFELNKLPVGQRLTIGEDILLEVTQIGKECHDKCAIYYQVGDRAKAAAGSDARMNGCSMPVVINSGSGNQGMTCSLPVIEYARELKVPKEKMYRALVVSNLVAIHQKTYIGSLSAYCGAVSAACGAGAAISWLNGGDYNAISKTITNALANTSGIVCDGAKSSCAAKIASAVDAAIMAYALEDADHCFQAGEGLVRDNVEDTIRNMGYVGRVGMKDTDVTILNLMINQKKV